MKLPLDWQILMDVIMIFVKYAYLKGHKGQENVLSVKKIIIIYCSFNSI